MLAFSFFCCWHLFEKKQLEAKNSTLGTVTYHDSCSGLRELGVFAQPRALYPALRDGN